ncbi:tail spike protein [Pectobacterium phage PP99]|uniref:Tail spike protein n=1 Tax=Pectobacterium phage PP99 TaxID=1932883 RepID=A0A1P8L663_9CAUD|nr:tail spike protein [Pectobacterium phage PP99]APW79745.1 tail spike protein [Pectobacterium phage PP99]
MGYSTKPKTSGITHKGVLLETKLDEVDSSVSGLGTAINNTNLTLAERNYPAKISAAQIQMLMLAGNVIKIDCRGDSTMHGVTSGNVNVQDPQNAPATLAKTLKNLYGVDMQITNNGISGSTLRQMMSGTDWANPKFLDWLPTSDADVIYCNHGINDSQTFQSIDQFRVDLVNFVNSVRKYGKLPILCTPNPCPPILIIDEAKTKRMEMFVDVIRDVATSMKVDLVDQYKYYMRTSSMVSLTTLVPDGAHPSSDAYTMSGRNMAIPFVSVNPLVKVGDKQGLTQGTYFDNITNNRGLSNQMTPFNRFGAQLVGTKNTELQGCNMAVLLEHPTDDTILAMYGAQWDSGSSMTLTDNGTDTNQYGGNINQGDGNFGQMDWEAAYLPNLCKLYAGLHVMGCIGTTTSSDTGDFSIAGWGLLPRSCVYSAVDTNAPLPNTRLDIAVGTTVEMSLLLDGANPKPASFCRLTDGTQLVNINYVNNGRLSITTMTGADVTIGATVSSGVYRCSVRFNRDRSITVSIGTLTATVPALDKPVPNMYLNGFGLLYSVTANL